MPAAPRTSAYAHIVHSPGVLGGEARIRGHRIRVRDIVEARDLGAQTPEEVVANAFPSLTLAQVYSALAYYEDHRREITLASEVERRRVEEFRRRRPESSVHAGSRKR